MREHPEVLIIAGPNGAGKSTLAPSLLRDHLNIKQFVNADVIASGLAAFDVSSVAFEAGRVMLARLRELAGKRQSFAFETTLAARSYASWLADLRQTGYRFRLVFLWLPDSEVAIHRVKDRVRMGGHDIPTEVVRRRYDSGLHNFFTLYQQYADSWRLVDNSNLKQSRLIAAGSGTEVLKVEQPELWEQVRMRHLP